MAFFELLLGSAPRTASETAIQSAGVSSYRTVFLSYDVASLCNWYSAELRAFDVLPYAEIACFLDEAWPAAADLKLVKRPGQFRLAASPPGELARLQEHALAAFIAEKRVDERDTRVVRLEKYSGAMREFEIRPCNYSDGLRSNYAMDWGGDAWSLRSIMARDYGPHLPPLDEPRLSNALGLAVIVWYRTGHGDVVPYLPRRAHRSAIFRGGFHSTASGEAEWRPEADTFEQMLVAAICKELLEEVGLRREDLEWIVPVALCREFLRGGKPQLFFTALAKVEARDLAPKRREAIARQIEAGRQEIVDDLLTVESPEQVYLDLARYGTIEALANMCYAHRCAESAYRAGAFTAW